VKRYAAEFCGTESLRNASRELVEDFIREVATRSETDLSGFKCLLQSYSTEREVAS